MKLQSVSIKKFRSIDGIELENVGGFNVMIGKNNSGKSNILSAINSFFKSIRNGDVVNLHTPIDKEIDFFNRKTNLPIEITLAFSLSREDRQALVQDIVTEAPQMKNAVGSLEQEMKLFVALCIKPPPNRFSFVSKIALGRTSKFDDDSTEDEEAILTISDEAALELYEKVSSFSQQNQDAEKLSKMLNKKAYSSRLSLSARLRREWGDIPFSYVINEIIPDKISHETIQDIQEKYERSSSYEEFAESVQTLAEQMKEEAKKVQEKPLKSKIDTFTGEGNSIPDYAKKLLCKVSEIKVLHLTERRKPIGEEEAGRLLSLKVKRGGEEDLRNIQETVSSLLGVRIDAFQGESSSRITDKSAELDVDNFLVEVNGSGIREALRLVLDVEFGHPNILLVEEPEIHLHPALETSMMRYLKRISLNCQVFITTHSTNFLDTAEMQNVYLISKPDSTQIQKLDIEEAEAQIPKELGIRLSSLFMFDRLVFVEGQSDEDIFREWASKLGINFSQANVGFISMGGVRNFAHFATEAILSFLTKRQVKIWFLIDRDEKEDSEVVELQNRLGNNAELRVLKKREIENYLICPRAIREFVKFKRESSGNLDNDELPDEAEIENKIEACADQLKQFAINKRVVKILGKPVYPSTENILKEIQDNSITNKIGEKIEKMIDKLEENKRKTESIYEDNVRLVNNDWSSNKLDIVPGDLLIDRVCKEYGIRFKKERDGFRLAALMNENEIDNEISEIIHEIGDEKFK